VGQRAQAKKFRRRRRDSRRHHYVPAAYLGLFGTPPGGRRAKIHVYDREQGTSRLDVPENVAYEIDLYRLDAPDPPHMVEDALAPTEGSMIDAIRNVAGEDGRTPTVQQAEAIVSFVALQHVRGPHVIEELNRFAVDASRLKLEMIARRPLAYETRKKRLLAKDPSLKEEDLPSREEILDSLRDDSLVMRMNNSFLVTTALDGQKEVFNALTKMELRFCWAPEGMQFVTGDRPVVLVPRSGQFMPLGIATAQAVVMPLAPKLLFMALPHQPYRVVESVAPVDLVVDANRRVSEQSRWTISASPFRPS